MTSEIEVRNNRGQLMQFLLLDYFVRDGPIGIASGNANRCEKTSLLYFSNTFKDICPHEKER